MTARYSVLGSFAARHLYLINYARNTEMKESANGPHDREVLGDELLRDQTIYWPCDGSLKRHDDLAEVSADLLRNHSSVMSGPMQQSKPSLRLRVSVSRGVAVEV